MLDFHHNGHTSKVPIISDNKIHPYTMPYGIKGYSDEEQAKKMLEDFKAIIEANPNAKIAITYSANNDQVVGDNNEASIIAGYKTGQYSIDGGGQAISFGILAQLIQKNNLQDKIHILPIATSIHAGGDGVVTDTHVKRDMDNIAKHLGAGWTVLGLKNHKTGNNRYSIGGGNSKHVWQGDVENSCQKALKTMTEQNISTLKQGDQFYYLKQAYEQGKTNANSLLMSPNTDKLHQQSNQSAPSSTPKPVQSLKETPQSNTKPTSPLDDLAKKWPPLNPQPTVDTDPNIIPKVNWDNTLKDHHKFVFTKISSEKSLNPDYIGSITSKDHPQDPLVNIASDKLQCPLDDKYQPKKDQLEAIATALQALLKEHNASSTEPLIVKANKDFTEEHLSKILDVLKTKNMPVYFQYGTEASDEIKELITKYNRVQFSTKGPKQDESTPDPPIPPSLRVKKT